MLRTLLASQPNFVSVPFWSDEFHFSVNVNGAAVAVPVNLTVLEREPDLIVSVPEYEPADVGANLTVTEPPEVDRDLDEIEKPVPVIDAVGVAVRFEPLMLTAFVVDLPSTHEKSIEVGLRVIVGAGVDDDDDPDGL